MTPTRRLLAALGLALLLVTVSTAAGLAMAAVVAGVWPR